MAKFQCRWRNVFICLCSPCICMAILLFFVMIMACNSMNGTSTPGIHSLNRIHFVASGTLRNKSYAPIAKTFWELETSKKGFWNKLQHAVDVQFNPILHPNNTKRKSGDIESLLKQSFSEVAHSDSGRKHFAVLSEPMQEFVRYMQRRDYPSIIQPDGVCGAGAKDEKEPPLLLLAIKTTELNFKNRQAIRQTWGQAGWQAGHEMNSSGGYIRRVFLLGKEDPETLGVDVSPLLRMESKHYGDILQWDFQDTFFNLTLKDVLFWDWFSSHCNKTVFVFKGDDDVFVNTPKMITYLQNELNKPHAHKTMKDFMIGNIINGATPDRNNLSKYFIPDSFYRGLYPSYGGGGGVVYSSLLTRRLHLTSKMVHLYPIDDVYVGMCMERLNTYPVHHPAFLTFDFPRKEGNELCSYHTILMVHKRSPQQLVRLWADLKKTQRKCWDVPLRHNNEKRL
ncbi:N-acetyllactosaminide beta-1,3-N-acetylglucosaminyltransferase 2 [Collichthys lucidus]|uniref:Hexosyltransferase n=1 Tax=Collichthys lucidus TaxID=240159 RepID=A0A4U5UF24_COLLU|nr:N-acetyllactosaminide beta-1,3-N-acetylglucosaminyltransferase 2 [Collichthys lucidus]